MNSNTAALVRTAVDVDLSISWKKRVALLFASMLVATTFVFDAQAASPPNLHRDIQWDEDPHTPGHQNTYANVKSVQAAFNNGRRQEESQLGLKPKSLGKLRLPRQSKWQRLSASQKALTILNSERIARGRANYAGIQPLGLGLQAVEKNLESLAQSYAVYMVKHNYWGHNGPRCGKKPFCNTDSFTRIDQHQVLGEGAGSGGGDCHEFIERAENLAVFGSTVPIPMAVERALYTFIYADAGSAWGHRETALLQDINVNGEPFGFTNNTGDEKTEGYFGVGVAGASNRSYRPLGREYRHQMVLVFLMIDPVNDSGCAYSF